jgi:hypothetical protein
VAHERETAEEAGVATDDVVVVRPAPRNRHMNRSSEPRPMPSLPTLLRASAVVSAFAGLVHFVAPGRLLELAGRSYDRVLAVRFQPRANATLRVRLVGVVMVVSAPLLARLAARVE